MEAGMIGLGGGLFGVALGFLASLCMNTVLQPFLSGLLEGTGAGGQISVIPWWVALELWRLRFLRDLQRDITPPEGLWP